MPPSSRPLSPGTLLLSHLSLRQLTQTLEREVGMQAAGWLQEAGFAGGESLYDSYTQWLIDRLQVRQPSSLDVRHLGETLSAFFQEFGWGTLRVTPLTPAVIALDSANWWEADPNGGHGYPTCHLSSGVLAELLSRISETTLGIMEVECRSRGDQQCRFLAGSPETLQILYGRLGESTGYLSALGVPA